LLLFTATTGCVGWFSSEPPAPAPLLTRPARPPLSPAERESLHAQSFTLRCAQPGVVRCVSLDSAEQIPDLSAARVGGEKQGRGAMGLILNEGAGPAPELDCAVAVSGCSLRFTVASRSGAGAAGSWFVNFSDDFSVRFGEGQEFHVQWRQRFSPAFLDTRYRGGGWKQAIIGQGDRPDYAPDGKVVWSCTQLELVVVNADLRGYPSMYHSCGGKDGQFEALRTHGAAYYEPGQWMTFQVRVEIGTWYRNDRKYQRDSTIELWVAREGETSQRAVVAAGYDIANTEAEARYGKLWLLPYHTGKDAEQEHPVAYTWYDEVIISRAAIPDP
jgi:hypothetical protein